MTRNFFFGLIASPLLAQSPTPTSPAVSLFFRLADTVPCPDPITRTCASYPYAYPYKWAIIDKPLTFELDAKGTPHLGLTAPPTAVRGEVPAFISGTTWTLAHAPRGALAMYRNGLRQSEQGAGDRLPDYTRSGRILTSQFFSVANDDALLCDYEW